MCKLLKTFFENKTRKQLFKFKHVILFRCRKSRSRGFIYVFLPTMIRQRNCSVAFSNTASIDIQLFSSALWLCSDRDNILLGEGGGTMDISPPRGFMQTNLICYRSLFFIYVNGILLAKFIFCIRWFRTLKSQLNISEMLNVQKLLPSQLL